MPSSTDGWSMWDVVGIGGVTDGSADAIDPADARESLVGSLGDAWRETTERETVGTGQLAWRAVLVVGAEADGAGSSGRGRAAGGVAPDAALRAGSTTAVAVAAGHDGNWGWLGAGGSGTALQRCYSAVWIAMWPRGPAAALHFWFCSSRGVHGNVKSRA